MSRVKILAPGAKGAQNGGEKRWIFVTGTTNSFFVTGLIGMKFVQKVYSILVEEF